jgi:N-glycosylase/DNA lyase
LSVKNAGEPDSLAAARSSLKKVYRSIKPAVDTALASYSALWENGGDIEIFREMCFCTCTPQTNAHKSWTAAVTLHERGLLPGGSEAEIANVLRECGVRFHNNKAAHIAQNRRAFYPDSKERIGRILARDDPHTGLCQAVTGWGLKEAAHFMRNIGFGHHACILDRHILRQLAARRIIDEIPKTLSPRRYREIDSTMRDFAKKSGIPLPALDLVFWYEETGEIFK